MAKISLTPQNFGTSYDVIPDIDAFVCYLTTSDPLVQVFNNNLEGQKAISGFLVLKKDGATDVFLTIISPSSFSLTRTANVNVTVGVY
jgi:hypothetical protein